MTTIKQLNVKQAQRWLEKLKNQNYSNFKELNKILKKYQKNDDQYQCYQNMSHLLLQTPILAKQLNLHLQDGNRFVVNEPEEEKITKLMSYMKQHKAEKFQQILTMIQEMSLRARQNGTAGNAEVQNRNLIACLKEIVKGDKQLEQTTNRVFLTGEQLIAKQDLQHLKVNHKPQQQEIIQDDASQPRGGKKKIKTNQKPDKPRQTREVQRATQQPVAKQQKKKDGIVFVQNMTLSEQKKVLKLLEKSLGTQVYDSIVKLIYLYRMCILTKSEIIDLIDFIESQEQFECLRDIIETRQNDRRKTGGFKPLSDNQFTAIDRASPSYVSVPSYYPIRCANRTQQLKKVLNDKWISVPYGSQETFNIRNKNIFERSLLKCEDQRYQFDLYTNRLKKASHLLDKAIQSFSQSSQVNCQDILRKIINMGVIQIVYRHANKQQKQELEYHLKSNQLDTCALFRDRINSQLHELKSIRQIHADRNWQQVALKNFKKSLDLKSFEFRQGQKEKMKGSVFINQLNQKIKILENGGQQKLFSIFVEHKKSFFSILNSFESSSKTQKCLTRELPTVIEYEAKQFKNKSFLPVMILAFENQDICSKIYSLILFYLENSISNDNEKLRSKSFLELVLVKFLGWKNPKKRCLSTEFDEQKFQKRVSNVSIGNMEQQTNFSRWIYIEDEQLLLSDLQKQEDAYISSCNKFNTLQSNLKLGYQPPKQQFSKILYTSEQFYVFLRFLYALYQRIIRMKQVAISQQKQMLFQVLFYNCIKSRQGVKFEEYLTSLFGERSYLFSTIYKLFENLTKSLNNAAQCQMTSQSFKYTNVIKSQQIYLLLMNRYNLENTNANSRIIRINYFTNNKVIYINSLYSYYRSEQILKDYSRKRQDINRGIQIYTLAELNDGGDKKKRKANQLYEENGLEYLFESNSYKMITYNEGQDLFMLMKKKLPVDKSLRREIKRVGKFNVKIN